MYGGWLDEGFVRPGARPTRADFEIAANCSVVMTDDVDEALDAMKGGLAFYIGGVGAKDMNFDEQVFAPMGYEAERIQDLFHDGRRDEAIAAVPRRMPADISLAGSREQPRDHLAAWQGAGVTMLVVGGGSIETMREVAEVILGA
ncbi:MAG: LLM class flavin-dependent oxidoreductase [Acidimicrobiales bacterium]|nr:LLM class flavin-dependent oxidoreductase [Acidimicrobiales bacterium]